MRCLALPFSSPVTRPISFVPPPAQSLWEGRQGHHCLRMATWRIACCHGSHVFLSSWHLKGLHKGQLLRERLLILPQRWIHLLWFQPEGHFPPSKERFSERRVMKRNSHGCKVLVHSGLTIVPATLSCLLLSPRAIWWLTILVMSCDKTEESSELGHLACWVPRMWC